jgi:hypothetical protein
LQGAGKTSLLTKFGQEHFKRVYTVDLSNDKTRKSLNKDLAKTYENRHEDDYSKGYADEVFKRQIPGFVDDKDSFLIIDEVRESDVAGYYSRKILQGLDATVAFTASFGDEAGSHKPLGFPAEDVDEFNVLPVTYREFSNSVEALAEYVSIKDFTRSNPDPHSLKIIKDSKAYFDFFFELGGFPDILMDGLSNGIEHALTKREEALDLYVSIVAENSKMGLTDEKWRKAIGCFALCMLFCTDSEAFDLFEAGENVPLFLTESLMHSLEAWFLKSGCLESVSVTPKTNSSYNRKHVFSNYEILSRLADVSGMPELKAQLKERQAKEMALVLTELLSLKDLYEERRLAAYHLGEGADLKEIGFSLVTKQGAKVVIDVKGALDREIAPPDTSIETWVPDFIVKISEGTAFVHGNAFSMPMHNIDRLPLIIQLIEIAHTNRMSLEKAYARYASGLKDDVRLHDFSRAIPGLRYQADYFR